jgi:hypothetical protein
MARSTKVKVREKKSTLRPTDLRREAMLGRGKENKCEPRCDFTYEYIQKEEGDNCPGSKVDSDGINFLGGVGRGSIG